MPAAAVVLQLRHDKGGTVQCTVTRSEERGFVAEHTSSFPNLDVACHIDMAGKIKMIKIRIDQRG